MMALKVTALPVTGDIGDQEMLVTIKSGWPAATVSELVSVLLLSLLSAMRLVSSTLARIVCVPLVAVQVLEPLGPLLAVSVRVAPAASEVVLVFDQFTSVPSTEKPTR